ncbi:MAG: hypothetical protein KGZ74_05680 [Chitinophagaceae bacterium]|nr:hypothetical protein [Chitinophagaceae bacterium]
MQKLITTFLLCFILTQSYSQTQRKFSAYLLTQYNKTLYDYTARNNPWGIGLGLQTFFNNKTNFKPTIELTGDIYLEDDKVLRLNPDGSFPQGDNSVSGMVNLFVGSSYHPTQSIYLSFVAGPSFISGQTFLGIKPSFGFYLSQNQRWTGKVSYINIFNRTKLTDDDFGSLSLAIGLKLF